MKLGRRGLIAALLLGGLGACDAVERPNRPLPEHFYEATLLDGQQLTRARMAGAPWVINLWVPG